MTNEQLLLALGNIDDDMIMEAEKKKPARRLQSGRLAVLVAAMLLMGCVSALAAVNEQVNDLLYRIWPYAAQALKPVEMVCEDQGIRMEVLSAGVSGQETLVTLTMRDLTGDRLDESVDLFDSAQLQLPYDGSGTCVLTGYDAESRTASFAVYMAFDMEKPPASGSKATFSVNRILTGKKESTVDLTALLPEQIEQGQMIPAPPLRGAGGSAGLTMDRAQTVKVLDPANSLEIPVVDGVTLTGVGFDEDGLHVQLRYSDILHTDNHGFLTLTDREGQPIDGPEVMSVSWFGNNGDSWCETLFSIQPEQLEQLTLTGVFVTCDPALEGNWSVTFPLYTIDS